MNTSLQTSFSELHRQHIYLLNKKLGGLPPVSLIEEAQSLLQKLRAMGRDIRDPDQRRRLGGYATYWGAFIYDKTGVYLNTALDPVKAQGSDANGSKISLNGGQQKASYQTNGSHIPFLAPQEPPYELVGRDGLLSLLKPQLLSGGRAIGLSGLPGVGKTALAVALAHDSEVQAYFSDGVLWAGLGHEPDLLALLGTWALALGFTSDEIAKQATIEGRRALLSAAIGKRSMLLVVDDVRQVEDALAFQIGGANSAFLVTTRQPPIAWALAGEQVTTVPELKREDGLALLKQLAPRAAAESEVASELVEAVYGLPLALILMGWELRQASGSPRRLRATLSRLAEPEKRLQLTKPQVPAGHYPALPANSPLSLSAVIGINNGTCNDSTRRTLSALALFPPKPNTFSEEAALAVAAEPVETLDMLVDAGYLELSGRTRYTLHPIIAEVTRQNQGDEEAETRMIEFFVALAEQKDESALSLEANNIRAALELAQVRQQKELLARALVQ